MLNIAGNGWGYGFTAGVTVTPTPTTTIGLGYRSGINQKISGSLEHNRPLRQSFRTARAARRSICPISFRSAFGNASTPQWTVLGTVEWTNWSRIGTSTLYTGSGAPCYRRDAVDHCRSSTRTAGSSRSAPNIMWSPAADAARRRRLREVADHRSTCACRCCRTTTGSGCRSAATYQWSPKISFDLAYSHLFVKSTSINITAASGNPWFDWRSAYVGDVYSHVDIVSVGLQYRWDEPAPRRRSRALQGKVGASPIAIAKRPAATPAFFVWRRALERPVEHAAVDQQILPGDVAGLRRAQEGAGRAEFGRIAEALGRDGGDARLGGFLLDAARPSARPPCSACARSRSVSKAPGRMLLMVTLLAATVRATPARNAVRPARAPDDRSRPASGIFTEPEVMLTMRPNLRWLIGSITFWISSTATIMLAMTPSIICCRVSSRKSRNGGPALLLTRMSGAGQAASSAFWPSGVATSAATAMILAPVAWRARRRSPPASWRRGR